MPIVVTDLFYVYMPGSPLETVALNKISLRIDDGEFVGLIGPTGSGKSTLVQHFNGLLKPSSGSVAVDGMRVEEAKGQALKKLRQRVGLLFQYPEHQLFEEKVFDDVAFGPRNLGVPGADIERKVTAALEQVGISPREFGNRSPFSLSGGQMRRVALAGVLAMEPKVLILDEPTAGLDPQGRREILELVRSIRDQGKTVILISHQMEDVARLATRVIVLHQGEMLLDGSPRQVFQESRSLQSIGLDVPMATVLMQSLRAANCPVRTDIITPEEACEEIAGTYGRRAHAGSGSHRAISTG
jgi:energy-coupling factor transport system ATP-binding protein